MSDPPPGDRDLRDARFEHDGCGVAFVATTSGVATNHIVSSALLALVNLGHRGATGADPDTGDGAGILLQVPDAFLRTVAGVDLPPSGGYGVGMVFLPAAGAARRTARAIIAGACADEGVRLLGWRDVPVDGGVPGVTARAGVPCIRQFFVAAVGLDGDALERRLYVLRRVIEARARAAGMDRRHMHIASLSSRTVVYKGMLTAEQLGRFYADLRDPAVCSALAIVHARFSTNVLPRWDLAQPSRMSAHNGEINTLRGNAAWMSARQSKFRSALFGGDIDKIRDVLDSDGSNSTQFDNALELLTMSGRSVEHAMMMMIPEAWESNDMLDEERRAFYEFHASLLEPWDGPAAIAFTDGRLVGASLDRNGLRPARYLVTDDGLVVMASEAGVLDIPEERIIKKWRLDPGRLLLVDTQAGAILDDDACKLQLAGRHPYGEWIRSATVRLDELTPAADLQEPDAGTIRIRQHLFGWTDEDLRLVVAPMAAKGEEPVGSMGNDSPLAVLSHRPQPLFAYFKQLFAQVTNPPIDPIREASVMSLSTSLGAGGNLLEQGPGQAARLEMPHPILTSADLATIRHVTQRQFPAETITAVFHRRPRCGRASSRPRAHLPARLRGGQRRAHGGHPQRPRRGREPRAHPVAPRHGGGASPPAARAHAHWRRPRRGERRTTRGGPPRPAHRLRRGGREPVPPARHRRRAWRRAGPSPASTPPRRSTTSCRRCARGCSRPSPRWASRRSCRTAAPSCSRRSDCPRTSSRRTSPGCRRASAAPASTGSPPTR